MQPGLYVVRRVVGLKSHVGILVVGNLLGMPRGDFFAYARRPPLGVLIHFNQAGLHRDLVYDLAGWAIERRMEGNVADAVARLKALLNSDQQYALLNNNCEHLVSYVETGERKSPQLRGWATAAAIIGGAVFVSRSA